jgi:hypothetical protein
MRKTEYSSFCGPKITIYYNCNVKFFIPHSVTVETIVENDDFEENSGKKTPYQLKI